MRFGAPLVGDNERLLGIDLDVQPLSESVERSHLTADKVNTGHFVLGGATRWV